MTFDWNLGKSLLETQTGPFLALLSTDKVDKFVKRCWVMDPNFSQLTDHQKVRVKVRVEPKKLGLVVSPLYLRLCLSDVLLPTANK